METNKTQEPTFPMFNRSLSIFSRGRNCEKYKGGEIFFEILPEYKTQENWEKDCTGSVFIPEDACLGLSGITEGVLVDIDVIGHTENYWITLDPQGQWPVLHPKEETGKLKI